MLHQATSTFQLNMSLKKGAGQPFGLNGIFFVIIEVCFKLMAQKLKEYFQVKVHHQ